MTFADQVLRFHFSLRPDWDIPEPFKIIYPYDNPATREAMTLFYQKFYADHQPRIFLFGINPGRFGAGVTGVPFTDPIRLWEKCGIPNDFARRQELSSVFVYEFIDAFGGIDWFAQRFYITSLSPLGFLLDGKNCNYYDDRQLQTATEPYIVKNLATQLAFGGDRRVAICIGKGQNAAYFQRLNERYQFFDTIIPLPHPRWVMQYRRKQMETFRREYVETLKTLWKTYHLNP